MVCETDLYQSVYRRSPVGLVVVDEDAQLMDVNEYMIDLFQLCDTPYKGLRFGTVFRCAELPQNMACGSTEACSRCRMRKLIRRVLEDGRFIHDIMLAHTFLIHDKPCVKWFKVSANAAQTYGRRLAVISFVDITKEKQYEAPAC